MVDVSKITELHFSLSVLIFKVGRGYVGGSTLQVDDNIEFNNIQYRITKQKGYDMHLGKYGYGVQYMQHVSGI